MVIYLLKCPTILRLGSKRGVRAKLWEDMMSDFTRGGERTGGGGQAGLSYT